MKDVLLTVLVLGGAAVLASCDAAPAAPASGTSHVVGFTQYSEYFYVARERPNGSVFVCSYQSPGMNPGAPFVPRGCVDLPAPSEGR